MRRPLARGAIFDLDGTLLDTLEDIARSANDALLELGFPPHKPPDFRFFIGNGARMLIQRALPEVARVESVIQPCLAAFVKNYQAGWDRTTRPYPGVSQALALLNRENIPLAVVSNKPHDFTTLCVERFFPGIHFSAVLGQKPGTPKKPAPDSSLAAAREMGSPTSDICFFGDSAVDILTAKAAGMTAVGVLWGFRSLEELQKAGSDEVIHSPGEIPVFFSFGP